MSDLLPCPFCGCTPNRPGCYTTNQGDKWGHVTCCDAEVRTGYDVSDDAPWHDDADREWNARPEEERLHARIATLEAALRQVEWLWNDYENSYLCPWCNYAKDDSKASEHAGHDKDCPRQAALQETPDAHH